MGHNEDKGVDYIVLSSFYYTTGSLYLVDLVG